MKKIMTFLFMITCALGLTACSKQEPTTLYDDYSLLIEEQNKILASYGEAPITLDTILIARTQYAFEWLSNSTEEYEFFSNMNDDYKEDLAAVFEQSTDIITDGDVIVNSIGQYIGSVPELGNISIDFEQATVKVGNDDAIVTVPITGDIHNGSFEVIYDKNLHATSFTTNVNLSFNEAMHNASVNTAIGMGTVFTMLIIIMIIIFILGAVFSGKNKNEKPVEKKDSVDKAIDAIVAREELSDDSELVAVIAAAIASYEGSGNTDGFVVRSIKRIK